jgi:cyclic pyranopterin phosphate synthase
MPAEGMQWIPGEQLLTDDEVVRLISLAVERLGIEEVRFTGGEPLLRPALERFVAAARRLGASTAITTNGVRLAGRAESLAAAGLDRVNVSLDTLSPVRFRTIARRNKLDDVLAGLAAATAAGLTPVKVNAVLLRGINDDEACDLLEFCLANDYELRFIEQMPLDPGGAWRRDEFVTAAEILDRLSTRWRLVPDSHERADAPAELWLIDGGPARVGVIGSVTRPFCADCNRTRLTADGQMRSCLFAATETDLRTAMRSGASDAELAAIWHLAMARKPEGHGVDRADFRQPARAMSAIGG